MSNINTRDSQLDAYRALIMMYILCVVHTTYWLGLGSEPWTSIILIEMPVIFFISGAAMSLQTKRKTLRQTVANRFRRLVAPYYVYLLFSILIVAAYAIVKNKYEILQPGDILQSILLLPAMRILHFSHIWFILPYLIIFLLFWFEQRIADKLPRTPFMLSLLILCGLSMLIDSQLIKEVVIYNFFFMAGYFYYRKCKPGFMIFTLIGSVLAMVLLQMLNHASFIPMQGNKFPPNLMFLLFGISDLSLLGLIFTNVRIPQNRLLRRWNEHGYTIYLWQNFIAIIVGIMIWEIEMLRELPTIIRILIASGVIFLMATASTFITVPIEKHTIRLAARLSARLSARLHRKPSAGIKPLRGLLLLVHRWRHR